MNIIRLIFDLLTIPFSPRIPRDEDLGKDPAK